MLLPIGPPVFASGAANMHSMEERCQGKMPVQELSIILKFLIPDSAAGSIIGKGGATVNELQTQTGSRIQLSLNAEIFPGTTDRIVTLCGTASSTLGALHLIISKLVRDGEGLVGGRPQVKLVIPNASCGCIIGRGGATIRNFAVDSQADIKLSSQEHMIPGVNERVLTISGPNDCVLRAVALVATALSQDESYEELISRPLTYTIDGISVPSSAMKNNHMNANRDVENQATRDGSMISIVINIPDEHIGAVLGKGGRTISEIQIVSGTRIKVSDRGDYVEGTKNRRVTLTGAGEKVRMAQCLLEQKLCTSTSAEDMDL